MSSLPRAVERLAWAAGVLCLVVWGSLHFIGTSSAQTELDRFAAAKRARSANASRPDMTLWSPARVQAWEEAQRHQAPAALAVLRIPKIKLEVPVLEGTDDWTLNRAVGHIEDTAEPGAGGNVGIAGHRDGFFRGLKDVALGDTLDLELLGGQEHYRIDQMWIVAPEDVDVIGPTPTRAVTLVTCYPFYFVGPAPLRYIVRAVPSNSFVSSAGMGSRLDLRRLSRMMALLGPGLNRPDPD